MSQWPKARCPHQALEGVLEAGLLQTARARKHHVESAAGVVVRALAAYPPEGTVV